jgi:hypothetical protein
MLRCCCKLAGSPALSQPGLSPPQNSEALRLRPSGSVQRQTRCWREMDSPCMGLFLSKPRLRPGHPAAALHATICGHRTLGGGRSGSRRCFDDEAIDRISPLLDRRPQNPGSPDRGFFIGNRDSGSSATAAPSTPAFPPFAPLNWNPRPRRVLDCSGSPAVVHRGLVADQPARPAGSRESAPLLICSPSSLWSAD